MATSGRPLDECERRRIERLRQHGMSIRKVAHETQTSTRTVQKYLKTDANPRTAAAG